ncbi:MAG: hypothetical protein ACRD9S_05750 [Pyrinomonadaceae bacterium]
MQTRQIFAYLILGLSLAATMYVAISAQNRATGPEARRIPVKVKQLVLNEAAVSVKLRCDDAEVVGNKVEKLSCVLKNGSSQTVIAASVKVLVTLDQEGKLTLDSGFLTFDSLMQSDFRRENNKGLIPPSGEYRL